MKHAVPLAAFAAFCALVGATIALPFDGPLWAGAMVGAAVGTPPLWLPRLMRGMDFGRVTEVVCLMLVIAVSVAMSFCALLPTLADAPVRVEEAVPLLLVAPALYAIYILFNRLAAAARSPSVAERVAAALSGPPMALTLALAATLATGAVLLIDYVGLRSPALAPFAAKFTERGIIPPMTIALFFWGLLLLANKAWVLWRERRLMHGRRGAAQKSELIQALRQAAGGGELASDDEFLSLVWRKSADFYVLPRYINWAIPILGFIGTVLGISLAADGIQSIISSRGSLADLSSELGQAIAPLGIAFDTTLIALSLSVFLTLLQTALQRWEDNVLVGYESLVRGAAGEGAV